MISRREAVRWALFQNHSPEVGGCVPSFQQGGEREGFGDRHLPRLTLGRCDLTLRVGQRWPNGRNGKRCVREVRDWLVVASEPRLSSVSSNGETSSLGWLRSPRWLGTRVPGLRGIGCDGVRGRDAANDHMIPATNPKTHVAWCVRRCQGGSVYDSDRGLRLRKVLG